MAQETAGIKIVVDGSQAVQSVGSLKKQLREAQSEVAALSDKFGATSAQAVEAAKKAADLRDRIGDAKALTEAFNPDRKFQAFASALQGVVGGFTAVQGALGLVGVESDKVQETLLKVQSALALSQGVNSVLEARDSFKNLSTVIQSTTIFQKANNAATVAAAAVQRAFGVATAQTATSFKILKGAIAATGIGLLVVGVSALISKISDWTSSTESNKAAQERLNRALEAQEELFAGQKESLARQREIAVKRAQIANASADEIFKINQSFNAKDRNAAVDNYNAILNEVKKFENERLTRKKNGNLEGSEEDIKAYNEAKEALKKANAELSAIDFKNQTDQLDNQIRTNNESQQKSKEAANKRKELNQKENQERLQANKEASEELRKLRQEAELNAIEDENQRAIRKAEIDFENRKLEIEALKASEQLKTELLLQAQKDRDKQIADAKFEASQAELTAILEGFDRQDAADKAEEERRKAQQQQEFDDIFAQLDRETEAEKKATEAKKQIAEEEAKFKKAKLSETADALGKLGEIVGKETAAGKALGIATALINTYQGATEALKQKSTLPSPFDFAAKAINVAAIVASGLKAVKAITAVKVPGGGGAPSIPSASITGGGAAPISPAAPQAALTQLDQTTINRLGSATNRAYVVESDVTNSQERIRRINRAARLN